MSAASFYCINQTKFYKNVDKFKKKYETFTDIIPVISYNESANENHVVKQVFTLIDRGQAQELKQHMDSSLNKKKSDISLNEILVFQLESLLLTITRIKYASFKYFYFIENYLRFSALNTTRTVIVSKINNQRYFAELYEKKLLTHQQRIELRNYANRVVKLDCLYCDSALSVWEDENTVCIIFQFYSYGFLTNSVFNYLGVTQHPFIKLIFVKSIIYQCLLALSYLHSKKYYYRSIHCSNILIAGYQKANFSNVTTRVPIIKLANFQNSIFIPNFGKPFRTTSKNKVFLSPEDINQGKSNHYADIWAIGMLAYDLLTRDSPSKKNISLMNQISEKCFCENSLKGEIEDRETIDFLLTTLNKDPNNRPNCNELLQHNWFIGLKLSYSMPNYHKKLETSFEKKNEDLMITQRIKNIENFDLIQCFLRRSLIYLIPPAKYPKWLIKLFEQLDTQHNGALSIKTIEEFTNSYVPDIVNSELVLWSKLTFYPYYPISRSCFIAALIDIENEVDEIYVKELFTIFDHKRTGILNSYSLSKILSSIVNLTIMQSIVKELAFIKTYDIFREYLMS